MRADVPGEYFLAGHVVDGSEIRLASRDLELGHVGAQLLEGASGTEVAAEEIGDVFPAVPSIRGILPPWVGPANRAREPQPAHDSEDAFGRDLLMELPHQAHPYLPVPAPVGTAMEDPGDQQLQIGPGDMRGMAQMIVVGRAGQSRGLQKIVEAVTP